MSECNLFLFEIPELITTFKLVCEEMINNLFSRIPRVTMTSLPFRCTVEKYCFEILMYLHQQLPFCGNCTSFSKTFLSKYLTQAICFYTLCIIHPLSNMLCFTPWILFYRLPLQAGGLFGSVTQSQINLLSAARTVSNVTNSQLLSSKSAWSFMSIWQKNQIELLSPLKLQYYALLSPPFYHLKLQLSCRGRIYFTQ